jgi:hypothetical protein
LRAVLLSDETTAAWLRENFVLSWEEVRPPAKVTIDFGNGKKLERTLAGNTAFYLTTRDGTVFDVFPGVYTPEDFRAELTKSLDFMDRMGGDIESQTVREYHSRLVVQTVDAELRRISGSKMVIESPLLRAFAPGTEDVRPPDASQLMPVRTREITASKGSVEAPILRGLGGREVDLTLAGGNGRYANAFDAYTASLVDVSKQPMSAESIKKNLELDAKLTPEERQSKIIALDSKTNVKTVRPAIHLMFRHAVRDGARPSDLTRLVFGKVLHIDIDDPYLGLGGLVLPGTPGGG